MKIDNEFKVGVPIDRAWAVLTDLAGIAPCLPGAQLTGVEDDVFAGKVKIKVGPVTSQYAGTARFVEKDDAEHHARISAKGKDSRGAGNANATIDARLREAGDDTVVVVSTDLDITGKIAQFGSGMLKEVSAKLLDQFATNLEAKLDADADPAAQQAAQQAAEPGPAAEADVAAPAPQPQRPVVAAPASETEPEALDLLDLAGGSVLKRLAPAAVVVVVLALIVGWRRRRR